jgi:hypothetical protein
MNFTFFLERLLRRIMLIINSIRIRLSRMYTTVDMTRIAMQVMLGVRLPVMFVRDPVV